MKTIPQYVKLVQNCPLPKMAFARQHFPDNSITGISAELKNLFQNPKAETVKAGMRVAITAGSRGFADFVPILRGIVEFVKSRGAFPFVVPAMGSHAGATCDGQIKLLEQLGVSEKTIGCPVLATMETVEVGILKNGMSVQVDKLANEADGIILYNRIKPHSAFRAPLESGLAKMLVIGLGKRHGAEICHMWGFGALGELIEQMALVKLSACKILFGVGVLENAYDRVSDIVLLAPDEMLEREKEYLKKAMRAMPRLPLGPPDGPLASGSLDVLIVDYIGKEFSGAGMDPNITGRPCSPAISGGPDIKRIVALDVTQKSMGNANGVSRADVITDRLLEKYDHEAVFTNSITSGLLCAAAIPMNMPNDRTAIQAAVKTCESKTPDRIRMIRIPNTLRLEYIQISEAMLPELEKRDGIDILCEPEPFKFDDNGNLFQPWANLEYI